MNSFSKKLFHASFYYLIFNQISISVQGHNAYNWTPSVSVAADLDEPQNLGYCIDIWGWAGNRNCTFLHSRTCKFDGDDTQFEYHEETKAIRAVNFNSGCQFNNGSETDRACVQVANVEQNATFFVDECDPTSENQIFDLVESTSNAGNYEFHIGDGFCVVVGSTSHRPGAMAPPMVMARDLFLSECDSVPSEFKTWAILSKDDGSDEETIIDDEETMVPEDADNVTNETASSAAFTLRTCSGLMTLLLFLYELA